MKLAENRIKNKKEAYGTYDGKSDGINLRDKFYFLFFLFFVGFVFGQSTAKEIIEQNLNRSGGIENWRNLNSMKITGKVLLGKDSYPMQIFQAQPNLSKTVFILNSQSKIIEGSDGINSYAMNYQTQLLEKQKEFSPDPFSSDLLDFEKKGFKATWGGEKMVDKLSCQIVILEKADKKTSYYLDKKNNFLRREESGEETILYSDYRKFGNFWMPTRIESIPIGKSENSYVFLISGIEVNPKLALDTFIFP